jgi:hypothetical protein
MPDARDIARRWNRSFLLGTGSGICANPKCRKAFLKSNSRHRYCRKQCAVNHYIRTVWYPANKQRVGMLAKACAHCGHTFEQPRAQRRKKEYCSRLCKARAGRARRRHNEQHDDRDRQVLSEAHAR